MPKYNATLIQDAGELIAYLEEPLWIILAKFDPRYYFSTKHVYEWLIREEIEVVYGLSCIGHNYRLDPYRKIRNKLSRAVPVPLEKLIPAHIKAPKIYDNPFVQVDLMEGSDLYIQYYQHGMQSALTF
jgi:hypothetical protein